MKNLKFKLKRFVFQPNSPIKTRKHLLIGAAALLLSSVLFILISSLSNTSSTLPVKTGIKSVTVRSIKDLSNKAYIETLGTIRSKSEGSLFTEASGIVTGVYAHSGQYVRKGAILAEIKNGTERAVVTQASGSIQNAKAQVENATANLDTARIQYEKIKNGATTEDLDIIESKLESAKNAVTASNNNAINILRNAYSNTQSQVTFGIDELFTQPTTPHPRLSFRTKQYDIKISLQNRRYEINRIVEKHNEITINTLNTSEDIIKTIDELKSEILTLKEYSDDLLTTLGDGIRTNSVTDTLLAQYVGITTVARTQFLAQLSALSGAKTAITSAQKAFTTVEKTKAQILSGARDEDVEIAKIAVKRAEAGLLGAEAGLTSAYGTAAGARSRLGKTQIIAPASGQITSFSIEKGDFVSMFQEIGFVADTSRLEIRTFISDKSAKNIKQGAKVSIGNNTTGTVTNIAPGLDPTTKQVEITISITPSKKTKLVHNSSVRIKIETTSQDENNDLKIPISALKMNAKSASVFSVVDNKLVKHPIIIEDIVGNNVYISGVQADILIITDARGFNNGDTVIVNK